MLGVAGCDTTSTTFGQGKIGLIKKLKQSKDRNATVEQVGEVGVRLFIIVFGGKQSDSLNTLRYAKYMEMVASAKNIDSSRTPYNSKSSILSQLACASASHSLEGTYLIH